MKRRSKKTIEYFDRRIQQMFIERPESKLTENRYKAIRHLLAYKYEHLMTAVSKETMLEFLRDAECCGRELRRATEDLQKEKKKILAQEFVVDHYNLSPANR